MVMATQMSTMILITMQRNSKTPMAMGTVTIPLEITQMLAQL
jgi:hypothetical protein